MIMKGVWTFSKDFLFKKLKVELHDFQFFTRTRNIYIKLSVALSKVSIVRQIQSQQFRESSITILFESINKSYSLSAMYNLNWFSFRITSVPKYKRSSQNVLITSLINIRLIKLIRGQLVSVWFMIIRENKSWIQEMLLWDVYAFGKARKDVWRWR